MPQLSPKNIEISEVRDFVLTMVLCSKIHANDTAPLRHCATKLAQRFTQPFSRDLAMSAILADHPVSVVNNAITLMNNAAQARTPAASSQTVAP